MASISIVLKAVDQYSGTLTGLNQGFELVSKAVNGMAAIADFAFKAIKTGADFAFQGISKAVELAQKGGNFSEMSRQFSLVAASYKVDGQAILDSIDRITLNMTSMTDAVKLAGKGVAAGLNEQQLADAFTFVKRRTELTGESFEAMAERMITALATGRTVALKDMGLIIEKGSSLEDIMLKVTEATAKYGDAGYNTSDSIKALNNQQDSFLTKLGAAINASDFWQTSLKKITDTAISLVKNFDFTLVTKSIDLIGHTFTGVVRTLDALGLSRWLVETKNEIIKFVDDWAALFKKMLVVTYDTVAGLSNVFRSNPFLAQSVFGDYYDPEALAEAETALNKIIKTVERGISPMKQMGASAAQIDEVTAAQSRLAEATQAAMDARRNVGGDVWQADRELAAAQDALAAAQAQKIAMTPATDDLKARNAELDALLEKATKATPKAAQAGLTDAIQRATATDTTSAIPEGFNVQAIVIAIGQLVLKEILGQAAGERLPIAITTSAL